MSGTAENPRPLPVELGLNLGRGVLMGSADIVPGVSGGTVALIVGIYEDLVHSVRAAASAAVALLRHGPAEARSRAREVHWSLVLPLGVGVVLALVAGSFLLEPLLEDYPEQMRGLFFGLVAASLAVPWRRIETVAALHWVVFVVAAVLAALLVGLPASSYEDPTLLHVFVAAGVAICAMILPGVSGAFLLQVLGLYEVSLAAVRGMDIVYIAVFVLGAAVGLGSFSKLLDRLLESYHDVTMAALVGLMLGSLRALWPWQDADRNLMAPAGDGSTWGVIALALVGFVLVTAMVEIGHRLSERAELDRAR